jgi:hypothetical protein
LSGFILSEKRRIEKGTRLKWYKEMQMSGKIAGEIRIQGDTKVTKKKLVGDERSKCGYRHKQKQ